jgi:hypothetical protein
MTETSPELAPEDYEAPEGVEEDSHPEDVPEPPEVETQDPEATE